MAKNKTRYKLEYWSPATNAWNNASYNDYFPKGLTHKEANKFLINQIDAWTTYRKVEIE